MTPSPLSVNWPMSELGQSRHFGRRPTTSGLPLEADIVTAGRHVSKVPEGDMPDQTKSRAGRDLRSPHRMPAIIPAAPLFAGPLRISRCPPPAGTVPLYPSDWKRAARGRAAAIVPALSVLAPAAPQPRCLRQSHGRLD